MIFERARRLVYVAALGWLSGEIVFRRWFYGQIPTPVPTVLVYGLILVNTAVISGLIRETFRPIPNSRNHPSSLSSGA